MLSFRSKEDNMDKQTDQAEAKSNTKKSSFRSPNYPVLDLGAAIVKARIIYEHEKKAPTTREVIREHLGYEAKPGVTGGPGGRAISALRQYGLLKAQGDQLKISEGAFTILHYDESSPERQAAIREAALK